MTGILMQYAQWSPDSDVHVQSTLDGGVVIFVAQCRHTPPREPRGPFNPFSPFTLEADESVGQGALTPIGGPADGDVFNVRPRTAIETLRALQRNGYRVPQSAFDRLERHLTAPV